MRRLFAYIVLSLAISALAAWLIALPGTVSIEVSGYRLQPGLGASIAFIIMLILAGIALWAIIRRVLEAPRHLAKRAQLRRRDMGVNALSDGFVALQAGDPAKARQLAREAQLRLPDNAAAQLLEARADLAVGDMTAAREHYRALISNPKTSLAALSGLYEQANAQGRTDAALTFARKAADLDPKLAWAGDAVFENLIRDRAWDKALTMVAAQPAPKKADKAALKHKQAVLNTAIAHDAEETDPDAALAAANNALKLEPNFVPAALIGARILINRAEKRKTTSMLRRVWRATGHPDIATLFMHVQSGASAVDRIKTLRQLIDENPQNRETACVLARAAIDAYEWGVARKALAPYANEHPTQNVCLLMAEIEEGQNGDQGKSREWLNRAIYAPRDPAWVADGMVSNEWEPTSPVTQKLDAFEWKVPTTLVGKAKTNGQSESTAPAAAPAHALEQAKSLALPGKAAD